MSFIYLYNLEVMRTSYKSTDLCFLSPPGDGITSLYHHAHLPRPVQSRYCYGTLNLRYINPSGSLSGSRPSSALHTWRHLWICGAVTGASMEQSPLEFSVWVIGWGGKDQERFRRQTRLQKATSGDLHQLWLSREGLSTCSFGTLSRDQAGSQCVPG